MFTSRNLSTPVPERFANFVASRSKGSLRTSCAREDPSERKAISDTENRVRDGFRRGRGVAGRWCVRSLAEFRAVHSNEA